jgi:hypothetical protein
VADKFQVDLLRGNKVSITIHCNSAYEARVLYEDIAERAAAGGVSLGFDTRDSRNRREEVNDE